MIESPSTVRYSGQGGLFKKRKARHRKAPGFGVESSR
jgi:hypothetical protein